MSESRDHKKLRELAEAMRDELSRFDEICQHQARLLSSMRASQLRFEAAEGFLRQMAKEEQAHV